MIYCTTLALIIRNESIDSVIIICISVSVRSDLRKFKRDFATFDFEHYCR